MLTGKQRARLRSLASGLSPVFQIGKGGIGTNLVRELDLVLEARELIKIHLLDTSFLSAREAAGQLSEILGAEPVAAIGSMVVLYRQASDPKKRRISYE